VTHDSGPLHIARLVDAPVVALFGPTAPATVVRGSARLRVLWPAPALPCAPCYDGQEFAACASNRCLQLIAPADVAAAVDSLAAR
jgi:ADP-heptose:LPS heptosyltransferase